MAEWTDVGPVDGFAAGAIRLVAVRGREVCILRVDEEVFAMRNSCPHAGAQMCAGRVLSRLVADRPQPAAIRTIREQQVVACPWHGWEFDPRDGRAIADPRMRLKTWPAKIDGDRVLVRV